MSASRRISGSRSDKVSFTAFLAPSFQDFANREGKEFYVILVTKHKFKTTKHKGPAVGPDLGVALPVCLSNGEAIAPDLGLEVLEKKAMKAQKRLSRAQRGSQRRKQTKQHLADIKRKQARRRTTLTKHRKMWSLLM